MLRSLIVTSVLFFHCLSAFAGLPVDRLSNGDIEIVKSIVKKLEPMMLERQKQHNHVTVTFNDLHALLDKKESKFLKKILALSPKSLAIKMPFQGISAETEGLIALKDQQVKRKGELKYLPVQFVFKPVYDSFQEMMSAMEKDIGKRLFIESGYRSSAYQLYLFVYYLQNHRYSILQTARKVALPGYSEHGSLKNPAIDFVSIDGIGNHTPAEQFEVLEEYQWLLKNAQRYGFVLSYPKNNTVGITFEPWHWRYEGIIHRTKGEKKK